MHKLPIGHLAFTVRQDDEAIRAHNSRHQCNVHGYTNMSTQEIVLATEDHEGHPIANGQRRTTLLHEVLHAALEASGLERDGEDEERWINALQGPLLVALQDKRFRELLTDPQARVDRKGPSPISEAAWADHLYADGGAPRMVTVSRHDLLMVADQREVGRRELKELRAAQERLLKAARRYDVHEG